MSVEWVIERWEGSAALLHGRALPNDGRRRASVLLPRRGAVVLGSTSPEIDSSHIGPHVDLVRRRSGGGLVWLPPEGSWWLDVFVPSGDPLYDDDVGAAFVWLGEAFAAALSSLGVQARVHRGRLEPGPDQGVVCFAGRGSGEVLVGDRKLVGISQRRTRAGSRFQCVWYRTWALGPLAAIVGPDAAQRAADVGIGTENLGILGGEPGLLASVLSELTGPGAR